MRVQARFLKLTLRDKQHGCDLDNWLKAESEVTGNDYWQSAIDPHCNKFVPARRKR